MSDKDKPNNADTKDAPADSAHSARVGDWDSLTNKASLPGRGLEQGLSGASSDTIDSQPAPSLAQSVLAKLHMDSYDKASPFVMAGVTAIGLVIHKPNLAKRTRRSERFS